MNDDETELTKLIDSDAVNSVLALLREKSNTLKTVSDARAALIHNIHYDDKKAVKLTVDGKEYVFSKEWSETASKALIPLFEAWFERDRKEFDKLKERLSNL